MVSRQLLVASALVASVFARESNSSLYVFGYATLLNQFTRMRTLCGLQDMTETELALLDRFVKLDEDVRRCIDEAKARELILVKARGVRRGWYSPGGLQYEGSEGEFSAESMNGQALDVVSTYLGAVADPNATTYAVIYPVTEEELAATDEREALLRGDDDGRGAHYAASWLNMDGLEVLSQNVVLPADARVRWYAMDESVAQLPTPLKPIGQSYVDIFVSGALQLQEASDVEGFAANVIASTADWSEHWVNDRVTPYRPFAKISGITRALQEATLVEGSRLKKSHLEAIYFPGAQKHHAAPPPEPQADSTSSAHLRGAWDHPGPYR
jgi:hypothetical protein